MKKTAKLFCLLFLSNFLFAQTDTPYEKLSSSASSPTVIGGGVVNRLIAGDNYVKMGNLEKALNEYDAALAYDASFVDAYMRRAVLYAKMGRLPDAIQDYNQAKMIDPYVVEVFDLYGRIRKNNVLKGISAEISENPGQCLFELKDRIEKENSSNAESFFLRGNVYVILGEYLTAIGDYEQAIRLNPEYVEARYNRGVAYILAKNYRAACEDFYKAAEDGSEKAAKKITLFCNR